MTRLITILFVLLATPALAQQPASANEQALLAKLTTEMSAGLQCSSALISATQAMEKAAARINELEAKPEPKPDAKKP